MRRLQRKSHHQDSHIDTEGSWAISYGDMITLLLSFFVLYFTVDHDKVKANQLQQALVMKFQDSGIASEKEGFIRKLNLGETPGDGVDPQILLQVGAVIREFGEQLLVEFKDVSFFELGVVDVNSAGDKVLSEFAKLYLPFAGSYDLKIQAFTDTRQVKGGLRFKDNLELSALRSVSAMRILQKAGIPLKNMRIAGHGEYAIEKLMEADRGLATDVTPAKDPLAFARKVVLIIEPRIKEGK